MTPVATSNGTVLCRVQLTGPGRWVSLVLSLGNISSTSRFLATAEHLVYEMAGIDDEAHRYNLQNWQGGVISGARYAVRALKAPIQQIYLHELRGQLGSSDVWALSAAAALAAARLLGHPETPLDLGGWTMDEEVRTSQGAAHTSQGAKPDSSQPAAPSAQQGNGPPPSGDPGASPRAHDLPER